MVATARMFPGFWLLALRRDLDRASDLHEDLRLLTSEVVTNAVRHSSSGLGGHVHIRGLLADDLYRVEVVDEGPIWKIPEQRAAPMAENGRGLLLIRHIAKAWGTREEDSGVAVWFELAIDPNPRRTGRA